jgi:hypothetical protein
MRKRPSGNRSGGWSGNLTISSAIFETIQFWLSWDNHLLLKSAVAYDHSAGNQIMKRPHGTKDGNQKPETQRQTR